jgi:hypothetical protein
MSERAVPERAGSQPAPAGDRRRGADHVPTGCHHAEQGSALPLLALGLVGLVVVALMMVGLSQRVVALARAQSAADAAALAGVVDGEDGARRLAHRNGAELVSFDDRGSEVVVRVIFQEVSAVATADRRLESRVSGCPSSVCPGP